MYILTGAFYKDKRAKPSTMGNANSFLQAASHSSLAIHFPSHPWSTINMNNHNACFKGGVQGPPTHMQSSTKWQSANKGTSRKLWVAVAHRKRTPPGSKKLGAQILFGVENLAHAT